MIELNISEAICTFYRVRKHLVMGIVHVPKDPKSGVLIDSNWRNLKGAFTRSDSRVLKLKGRRKSQIRENTE